MVNEKLVKQLFIPFLEDITSWKCQPTTKNFSSAIVAWRHLVVISLQLIVHLSPKQREKISIIALDMDIVTFWDFCYIQVMPYAKEILPEGPSRPCISAAELHIGEVCA